MSSAAPARRRSRGAVITAALVVLALAGFAPLLLVVMIAGRPSTHRGCAGPGSPAPITRSGPGGGTRVGATEYGGPGDPSSGTVGSSGVDLDAHPDSYAELGGTTFQTATALGGLPYETPLRITWAAIR